MQELESQLKEIMIAYRRKYQKVQARVHTLKDSLQIRTQSPNQTTPEGRAKFLGHETIWLQLKQPKGQALVLAKLSELKGGKYEFQAYDALEANQDLVFSQLDALRSIALPK